MNSADDWGAPAARPTSPPEESIMLNTFKAFIRQDDGVTAVEYAVLAVLIIAAVAAAMVSFEDSLTDAFETIGTRLTSAQA